MTTFSNWVTNILTSASTLTGTESIPAVQGATPDVAITPAQIAAYVESVSTGGGAVTSVSNSDGTITISPNTGNVVVSRPVISGDGIIATGTNNLILATVNTSTSASGSSTSIPTITANSKGLVTAISTNVVVAPAGTLTGTALASGIVVSSLTSVGNLSNLSVGGVFNLSSYAPNSGDPLITFQASDYGLGLVTSSTDTDTLITIAPNGVATGCAFLLVESSTFPPPSGGYNMWFGGGFGGSISGAWNFASLVNGQATSVAMPIAFVISNSGGRYAILTLNPSEIVCAAPVRLQGYTVATLPAGNIGDTAYVTDALVPTFLGTLTGGGTTGTPVFYNGTAWVAG